MYSVSHMIKNKFTQILLQVIIDLKVTLSCEIPSRLLSVNSIQLTAYIVVLGNTNLSQVNSIGFHGSKKEKKKKPFRNYTRIQKTCIYSVNRQNLKHLPLCALYLFTVIPYCEYNIKNDMLIQKLNKWRN